MDHLVLHIHPPSSGPVYNGDLGGGPWHQPFMKAAYLLQSNRQHVCASFQLLWAVAVLSALSDVRPTPPTLQLPPLAIVQMTLYR